MLDLSFIKENWDKLWTLLLLPAGRWIYVRWTARRKRLATPAQLSAPVDPREIRLSSPLKSAYFANQPDGETCILEGARVLLSATPLSSMFHVLHVFDIVARAGAPLVVIAPDVTDEVLATMIKNNALGTLRCCAVAIANEPRVLRELRKMTGAVIFHDEAWRLAENAELVDCGRIASIVSGATSTIILGHDAPSVCSRSA
jgi:chaperonin GroEL